MVPTPPGKSWKDLEFLLENFQELESPEKWPWSWKVLEICWQSPGKTWNLLGSDVHGSFWFQIEMFMQTKITIIVSIRYVFWAAGMPKMLSRLGFLPARRWWSLQHSPRLFSCCLLLYLNIAGLRRSPGKCFWGFGKVLDFFVTKRVGTLLYPRSIRYLFSPFCISVSVFLVLRVVTIISWWVNKGDVLFV